MRRPASPRAWTVWAFGVLTSAARPHSIRYDLASRSDHRTRCAREVALTVKLALERSVNGKGTRGVRLLVDYYLSDPLPPWDTIPERDRRLMRSTERRFRVALIETGFLADPDRPDLPR
jgi:hypothetical protein